MPRLRITGLRLPGRAAVLAATAFLAACASAADAPGRPNMGHACQTMECECAASDGSVFTSAKIDPVLWKVNGDAFCAAGFELRRKGKAE